ncbi:substrate-binding periplasmic protein [Rheinheimera aquimaris]|jgi:polar amino acid transport system substrate-binding protein|uniref:substrate-binding periplasmic protein n=1 Tax=Rheinheimera aquimaris TaxID=412437 RepID=UPI000E89BE75|nr:transporter substrate-binding domain-containing protein [Rheinheimera aquimaris]MCD1600310.1 transporter substrate-binding domain-containing protein [Rheinheimera aquimaris]HBN87623.1 amino acid ABC transporter/signal transduction system protein [Rheinheimera sp.]|tara:strand:+ start:157 stop:885 length:729 start_codon:yes stop_codon:yes gene_type:complete
MKYAVTTLLLFCCWPAQPCQWPELSFLVGVEKPPYIEVATQSGYELELLQQVSLKMHRCAVFIHSPNGRLLELFKQGVADFASLQRSTPDGTYATLPYISYENVVITRSDLQPPLQTLDDLTGRRVMAFQNARQFLPPAYAELVPRFSSYLEVVEQHQLPVMLLKGRIDALVMDKNIFEYYYRQIAPGDQNLQQLPLFGKNSYHLLGRDPWLVQRFDQALQLFQLSKEYQQLQLKYFQQVNQ